MLLSEITQQLSRELSNKEPENRVVRVSKEAGKKNKGKGFEPLDFKQMLYKQKTKKFEPADFEKLRKNAPVSVH